MSHLTSSWWVSLGLALVSQACASSSSIGEKLVDSETTQSAVLEDPELLTLVRAASCRQYASFELIVTRLAALPETQLQPLVRPSGCDSAELFAARFTGVGKLYSYLASAGDEAGACLSQRAEPQTGKDLLDALDRCLTVQDLIASETYGIASKPYVDALETQVKQVIADYPGDQVCDGADPRSCSPAAVLGSKLAPALMAGLTRKMAYQLRRAFALRPRGLPAKQPPADLAEGLDRAYVQVLQGELRSAWHQVFGIDAPSAPIHHIYATWFDAYISQARSTWVSNQDNDGFDPAMTPEAPTEPVDPSRPQVAVRASF